MDLGIHGRSAIVTGGSRGIGRETARTLLEAGARVAICARNRETLDQARGDLQAKTGGEVLTVVADMAIEADVERLVREATARFGGVDILVNNAGQMYSGRFDALTEAGLRTQLDIKLFGFMRAIRLVAPGMKARRWGRIVNIIGGAGKEPDPYMPQSDQSPLDGAGRRQRPRQRRLPRLGRHRHVASQRRRPGGGAGRRLRGRGAPPGRPQERARALRPPRRAGRRHCLPLLRARQLHHRRLAQPRRRPPEGPLVEGSSFPFVLPITADKGQLGVRSLPGHS